MFMKFFDLNRFRISLIQLIIYDSLEYLFGFAVKKFEKLFQSSCTQYLLFNVVNQYNLQELKYI